VWWAAWASGEKETTKPKIAAAILRRYDEGIRHHRTLSLLMRSVDGEKAPPTMERSESLVYDARKVEDGLNELGT